jgi:hypothetical protein
VVSHHRKHNGSHRGILGNREEVPATHVMYPGRKCKKGIVLKRTKKTFTIHKIITDLRN